MHDVSSELKEVNHWLFNVLLKDGAMDGGQLNAVCMFKVIIALPRFQSASWVTFLTAIDISDDEGAMAMDLLFKPGVEATEQMTQNCIDISQSKNQRVPLTWGE